ncbi:hypothetical protein [Taibaiella koreensis]|uniref:hypothetical protein n=1 Tax=Taibaiella koreensis TaxID=1268548 RepID=UPI0013C2B4B5|nr:hypothetical protein [Taibaiella koreensis]
MIKKTEIALVLLALLSLVLRVSSVPGSEWFSTAAFGLLALFYLVFAGLRFDTSSGLPDTLSPLSRQREQAFRRFLAIAGGVVFGIALIGILFVLNYWRLAAFFWCLGMFFTVPVGALSLGKHLLQPSPFYKALAIRAGLLLLTGIGLVAAQM